MTSIFYLLLLLLLPRFLLLRRLLILCLHPSGPVLSTDAGVLPFSAVITDIPDSVCPAVDTLMELYLDLRPFLWVSLLVIVV